MPRRTPVPDRSRSRGPQFRKDSLTCEKGRSNTGWEAMEVAFPEDVEAGRVLGVDPAGTWYATKKEAMQAARMARRHNPGTCW